MRSLFDFPGYLCLSVPLPFYCPGCGIRRCKRIGDKLKSFSFLKKTVDNS